MHVGGIVAPALGPIARRVRLLKSEGTKKENEREFKKKCPRPTWNKFFSPRTLSCGQRRIVELECQETRIDGGRADTLCVVRLKSNFKQGRPFVRAGTWWKLGVEGPNRKQRFAGNSRNQVEVEVEVVISMLKGPGRGRIWWTRMRRCHHVR